MTDTRKVILDLCAGTGAWSQPYADAGYDVRLVTLNGMPLFGGGSGDVAVYHPPADVYGILAAPPCTQFSFARTNAVRDRNLAAGMETVYACLRIIWECQGRTKGKCPKRPYLAFWAIENPHGMLTWFLGKPALTFDPFDFGEKYRKKTCLWGCFNNPAKNPVTLTAEENIKFDQRRAGTLPDLPDTYVLPEGADKRAARRAVTPPGFAKAFFEANR